MSLCINIICHFVTLLKIDMYAKKDAFISQTTLQRLSSKQTNIT